MNEWMNEERIEADIPWFTQKANNAPRQGTCSVHVGRRRPPGLPREWRRRAPSRSGLRSPGRKVNTESLYAPRDQPEKESKREREKERKKDTGEPGFCGTGPSLYFSGNLLYLDLYIEGNERCKVIQSQPKHYICFVFIETRIFFCIPFP